MIPVSLAPAPDDFDQRVRDPGDEFLRLFPQPRNKDWIGYEHWRDVLPELRSAYKAICAYCAHWIPLDTGASSVDHFIPKSEQPNLAFDWNNFRLASSRYNARKGIKSGFLDPCHMAIETYHLDFETRRIKLNPNVVDALAAKAQYTIDELDLNDELSIQSRENWLLAYIAEEITFDHLRKKAPFITYELERQGLIDLIKTTKKYRVTNP